MHGVRDSVRERGAAAPHQVRQVSHRQQEAPRPSREERHEGLPRPGGQRGILVLHLPLLQGNSDSILSVQPVYSCISGHFYLVILMAMTCVCSNNGRECANNYTAPPTRDLGWRET